jgi:hypothetical protein
VIKGNDPQHCTKKYEPPVRTLGTFFTETTTSALVFVVSGGTTAEMAVSDHEVTAAACVPWNMTLLSDRIAPNRAPAMVRSVPGRPEDGETL